MTTLRKVCSDHITQELNRALEITRAPFTVPGAFKLMHTIDSVKGAVKLAFNNLTQIQSIEDKVKSLFSRIRWVRLICVDEKPSTDWLTAYDHFVTSIEERLSLPNKARFTDEELDDIRAKKDTLKGAIEFIEKGALPSENFLKLGPLCQDEGEPVVQLFRYLVRLNKAIKLIEEKLTERGKSALAAPLESYIAPVVRILTGYVEILESILESGSIEQDRSLLKDKISKIREELTPAFSSLSKIELLCLNLIDPQSLKTLVPALNAAPEIVYQEEACLEALKFLRYPLHLVSQHARDVPPLEWLSARFSSLTEGNFRKMLVDRDWESSHPQEVLEYPRSNIYIGDSIRKEVKQTIGTGDKQKIRESLLYMFLDHPHILKIHTITKRSLFLERALHDMYACIYRNVRCHHYQPLTMIHYLEGTAKAIQYLHGKGLIHKDIKPENVLVFDDRLAKLGDFGGSGIAQDWLYACTPDCAAPEVTAKRSFSFASDVWSFGCVIYTILTKRDKPSEPFFSDKDRDNLSVMDKTGGLRGVMEGCLAHDPSGRLSMGQVVRSLSRMLIGEVSTERAAEDLSTLSVKEEEPSAK